MQQAREMARIEKYSIGYKAYFRFQNGATTKTYRNKCKKPERDGAHVELDGGKLVAASKMAATTKTYRNKCKKPERDGDM